MTRLLPTNKRPLASFWFGGWILLSLMPCLACGSATIAQQDGGAHSTGGAGALGGDRSGNGGAGGNAGHAGNGGAGGSASGGAAGSASGGASTGGTAGGASAGAGGVAGRGPGGATGQAGAAGGAGTGTGGGSAGQSGAGGGIGGAAAGTSGQAGAGGGSAGHTGATGGRGAVPSNIAFVTSQTFSTSALATLGSGTGADAVLRGADKACTQAAAATGALVPAGTYVAWISSRSQDALARLAAAHGGVAPRGWSRVDGRPFVDQIPAGSLAHIYYPLAVTELGDGPPHVWAWTGTDSSAAHVSTSDCMDWASAASSTFGVVGLPTAGGSNWTGGVAAGCDNALPLYCLQVDHATAVTVPAPPANAKRVFMTSGFSPSTGLAGADAACASDAQHAGLSGTFRAALATTTASAASRFHPSGTRAFVRLDGVVVATVDSDLFQASPKMLAPINVDTSGNFSGGTVYFGATDITQVGTNTCANWTDASAASMVTLGVANYTGTNAFDGFTDACNRVSEIYCLED